MVPERALTDRLPQGKDKNDRILTRNFVAVCTANCACFGSFYLFLATLPVYVIQIGGNEAQVGFIIGVFSATALVVRPIVGRAGDTLNQKLLVLLGASIMTVSGLLYIGTGSVPSLLLLRVFHGVGFAVFGTIAITLVAEISPMARRGEAIGYYGGFQSLAMIGGPALGVLLMNRVGFTTLFISSAGLALIGVAVLSMLSIPARSQSAPIRSKSSGWIDRSALLPGAMLIMMAITYASVISFMPLLAEHRKIGNMGLFFAVLGVMTLTTRGPFGRLSDKYGRRSVIIPGMCLLAAGLVVASLASSLIVFLASALLYGLGFAAVQPAIMALTVDRANPQARGAAMGTITAAMDFGMGVGSFMWGFVLQAFGFTVLYLAAAAVGLAGAVMAGGTVRSRKANE